MAIMAESDYQTVKVAERSIILFFYLVLGCVDLGENLKNAGNL